MTWVFYASVPFSGFEFSVAVHLLKINKTTFYLKLALKLTGFSSGKTEDICISYTKHFLCMFNLQMVQNRFMRNSGNYVFAPKYRARPHCRLNQLPLFILQTVSLRFSKYLRCFCFSLDVYWRNSSCGFHVQRSRLFDRFTNRYVQAQFQTTNGISVVCLSPWSRS